MSAPSQLDDKLNQSMLTQNSMPSYIKFSRARNKSYDREEVERLHQQSLIVEGHRDIFEMVRLKRSGEKFPLLKKILPRLKRGGITISVFAVCGHAVSHSNGTYRYLHAALRKYRWDAPEAEGSGGKIKFILSADDLPAGPVNDTVYFLLSFEGGKPLEGRLEYLCSFYQLGLRSM